MTSIFGPPGTHQYVPSWPPPAPVGYLSRKALPIKRNDAEPLTREDVQYDLLKYIFDDDKAVFTNPHSSKGKKVTFSTLYTFAIYHSSKCSKVLRDKMSETPEFASELAKISLLTNVGRINTTMAFFPEMKTALRTYHPVPSLQKTDGNAQDAPRIKNCLKAALLPSESKGVPPATPEEILEKRKAGLRPPTSVVNLVFVLATHCAGLATIHFDGTFNFLDLFLPGKGLASQGRAQIFLWLVYHYLEASDDGENPFADEFAKNNPGKAPSLRTLSAEEQGKENVDTPEEIQWGRIMSARRNTFLQQLVTSIEQEKKTGRNTQPLFISVTPETGVGRRSQRHVYDTPSEETSFLFYVPKNGPNPLNAPAAPPRAEEQEPQEEPEPEVGMQPEPDPEPEPEPVRVRVRERKGAQEQPQPQPRSAHHERPPLHPSMFRRDQPFTQAPQPRHRGRSMLEHAWIVATTTDPLEDSDDDMDGQHVLQDYGRRLKVLTELGRQVPPHGSAEGTDNDTTQIMGQIPLP
ncbi:hypothetical protein D9611_003358 [Ephemerocybe angulata]|uniref:Ino eighty subunit 1 n=1 Tax=Ephemerocybe angulata TaxID=980116 RepID=A0A8H5FH83_9AGAR|nr:hypothetical protein D9611_003358 [Tulosesus angulatus]